MKSLPPTKARGDPYGFGGSKSELYDPATEQWTPVGDIPHDIPLTVTALQSGNALVIGEIGIGPQRAQIYDAGTGTWSVAASLIFGTSPLSGGYYAYKATVLADGRVLISGSNGALLYDSATDTMNLVGQPFVPRHNHTATRCETAKP